MIKTKIRIPIEHDMKVALEIQTRFICLVFAKGHGKWNGYI